MTSLSGVTRNRGDSPAKIIRKLFAFRVDGVGAGGAHRSTDIMYKYIQR